MQYAYEKFLSEYASYQIHICQFPRPIETLERGRGLCSELRGFRVSTDIPCILNPPLAKQFAFVNRDLEALTKLDSSNSWTDDGKVDSGGGMELFSQLVVRQRNLGEERDRLLSQIQALLGFENFMKAPSSSSTIPNNGVQTSSISTITPHHPIFRRATTSMTARKP
jgi:hypothetical protein